MSTHRFVSFIAGCLLAACGGGRESPVVAARAAPAAATAAEAAQALRARARALAVSASATSPATAERLLNLGEQQYPQYFPGSKTTQSFPPFLYRYYPETGIYLGDVVTAGGGYTLDGVYVLGGPFGSTSPTFVGLVSAYVPPDPPPTGQNNGCYDLPLFDTPGTRVIASYQSSGLDSGTVTEDSTVGDLVTFEGRQAREIASTITSRTSEGEFTIDGRFYSRTTGDAEITEHGNTTTTSGVVSGFAVTITSRSVTNPPVVDRRYGLAIGESLTITETATTTTTTRGIPGLPETPQVSTDTTTTVVKYVGRERITVPAGTYDTCRFEESYGGSSNSVIWVIAGKGIEVKVEDRNGSNVETTEVATSVTLNGVRL